MTTVILTGVQHLRVGYMAREIHPHPSLSPSSPRYKIRNAFYVRAFTLPSESIPPFVNSILFSRRTNSNSAAALQRPKEPSISCLIFFLFRHEIYDLAIIFCHSAGLLRPLDCCCGNCSWRHLSKGEYSICDGEHESRSAEIETCFITARQLRLFGRVFFCFVALLGTC